MVVSSLQLVVIAPSGRAVRPGTPGGVRIHQGSFDFQAATALSEEESQSLQAANVGSARIFAGMVWWKKQAEVQMCLRNRRYLETLGSGYLISDDICYQPLGIADICHQPLSYHVFAQDTS